MGHLYHSKLRNCCRAFQTLDHTSTLWSWFAGTSLIDSFVLDSFPSELKTPSKRDPEFPPVIRVCSLIYSGCPMMSQLWHISSPTAARNRSAVQRAEKLGPEFQHGDPSWDLRCSKQVLSKFQ